MDITLSRRAASALLFPPLADFSPNERAAFAARIDAAPEFLALRRTDRELIEASEAAARLGA